jgi:carboxyl-terminal processing protease
MHKTKTRAAVVLLLLAFAFGAGVWAGVEEHNAPASAATGTASISIPIAPVTQPTSGVDLSQFWAAWNLLEQNYIPTHSSTTPSTQERVWGAISGLTNSYGDPYTVFLPPSDASIFNSDISGQFEGVGMQMDTNAEGQLIVVAPLKGSPAEKAGVESGDLILAIDGTSTQGMTTDQAVQLIRGPKGTTVTLTLGRAGMPQPVIISVVRSVINVPEINTYARADGIFVIQLYTFTADSANLFRDALRQFFESGDTKLIFDLRGNPGGYLDAAVDMASYFLPVGDTVVTEDFEGRQANVVHRSYGYNVFANKKLSMAILVDQGSASASEILSGALQQHGVAKLVGTKTFGKGSVQELFDLGGGAEIKITVARWLTPNGTSISNGGLTPDIMATTTAADKAAGKDPTMDAAAAWLMTQ